MYVEKMNQSNLNDESLRNIGGSSKNNLDKILNNFTDTAFEIDTFSESPSIDIDFLSEQLIQSMNVKFDMLLALITYLNDNNIMFSATFTQESWIKQGQDISFFHIPCYILINLSNICSEHGRLITYLKEG